MQHQRAQLATDIEAASLLVYNAARMKDRGLPFIKQAAMAKYFTSEVSLQVRKVKYNIEAILLLGGEPSGLAVCGDDGRSWIHQRATSGEILPRLKNWYEINDVYTHMWK